MKEIKLSDGRTIKMRKPKVRDIRIAHEQGKNEVEVEMILIGNLTGNTFDEVDDMDYDVYLPLQESLKGFLSSTGKKREKE